MLYKRRDSDSSHIIQSALRKSIMPSTSGDSSAPRYFKRASAASQHIPTSFLVDSKGRRLLCPLYSFSTINILVTDKIRPNDGHRFSLTSSMSRSRNSLSCPSSSVNDGIRPLL